MKNEIKITGVEANLLLFLLDDYIVGKWQNGRVIDGYDKKAVAELRDKLFDAHEHPAPTKAR